MTHTLAANLMASGWGHLVREADAQPRDVREEAAWIVRAKTGDEAAYRWLLEQYRGRAVRLAAHVLGREAEAEDVAQEAFVRAFRHLGTFRGDGPFSAWLFGIVVRLCLDRRRSARWTREGGETPPDAVAADTSEAIATRLAVHALLKQLTPPLRAALVLRELEGLDYPEIAAALSIPVGTVRSRLHAARAQFRTLWLASEEASHE